MKNITLGLDVSTSKIGYSIIDDNKSLIEYGTWKYKTDIQLENRVELLIEELKILRNKYDIRRVYVEEPFIAFSGGRTTAVTMAKLQRFNGMCCYGVFHIFGYCPTLISANQARKSVGIQRKKGEDVKKKVIEWVKKEYPKDFIFELTRYGNPKPGTDDMADAIVVALAGLNLKQ
jgi:Holliday junction resolvasome RuvABC endonuclease subunit